MRRDRGRALRLGGALVALLLAAPVARGVTPPPAPVPELGLWLTDTRDAVVRISRCGAGICGEVVGMQYSGAVPVDVHGGSKCGLVFIYDMRPDDGGWTGRILDPDDGHVYSSRLRMLGPDRLSLRGYLLIPLLGGTRVWTRYRGPAIGPHCHLGPVPPAHA